MKSSQLITLLHEAMKEHGDIDVRLDSSDGEYVPKKVESVRRLSILCEDGKVKQSVDPFILIS